MMDMEKKEFGIVYVATGEKYREECTNSAQSAKKAMPDIPITLWTDRDSDIEGGYFDSIHIFESPKFSFFDKIPPLLDSPYEKTLFLDTDTYVLDGLYEISLLLDQFDFAFCHAPNRMPSWAKEFHEQEGIPSCFPQPNTGVIAYRKKPVVLKTIESWKNIYIQQLESENPPKHDQLAGLKAFYESEARSFILPPEYNIRTHQPVFRGGQSKAKILHGRDASLEKAIKEINSEVHKIGIFNFQ